MKIFEQRLILTKDHAEILIEIIQILTTFKNSNYAGPFTTVRPPPSSKIQLPISRTYSNLLLNQTFEPLKEEESMPSSRSIKPSSLVSLEDELKCPAEREARFELFPVTCNKNQDCFSALGKKFRCCKLFGGQRCHEGLEVPLVDIQHERK